MVNEYGFGRLTAEVVMNACMNERGTALGKRTHPAEVIVGVCADYGLDPTGYIARYCVDRRQESVLVKLDRRQTR